MWGNVFDAPRRPYRDVDLKRMIKIRPWKKPASDLRTLKPMSIWTNISDVTSPEVADVNYIISRTR
jgi:hypothetical protein